MVHRKCYTPRIWHKDRMTQLQSPHRVLRRLPRPFGELLLLLLFTIPIFQLAQHYDLFESVVEFVDRHENWELDETLIVAIYLVFGLALFAFHRWHDQRQIEQTLRQHVGELNNALAEVRQLQGVIPICASCKNIRDDQGYWHQVETYIHNHSAADFSHGICPECMAKLYPRYEHVQRLQAQRQ